MLFLTLSLIADFTTNMITGVILTIPILLGSWWVAYKSGWFE